MLLSRKVDMQTHQIHVSNGREAVHEIRRELFLFPEVLEVFDTGRPDVLVVVYVGRPRPGEWLRALRELGYQTPPRRHAVSPKRHPILASRASSSEPLLRAVAMSNQHEALR